MVSARLKVALITLGVWALGMLILYLDQFTADWGLLVTLNIATFGLILDNRTKIVRLEQYVIDNVDSKRKSKTHRTIRGLAGRFE